MYVSQAILTGDCLKFCIKYKTIISDLFSYSVVLKNRQTTSIISPYKNVFIFAAMYLYVPMCKSA